MRKYTYEILRNGDLYTCRVKDAAGNTLVWDVFYTKLGARRWAKKIAKRLRKRGALNDGVVEKGDL